MKTVSACLTAGLLIIINSQLASSDPVSCVECNNCTQVSGSPKTCQGEYCYTRINENHEVERGCSADKIDPCANSSEVCESCQSFACNNSPHKFPTCINSKDEKEECKGKDIKCYYYEKGTRTEKGCISAITDEDIKTECAKTPSKTCKVCTGDDCNQDAPLKCVTCDQNDPACTALQGAALANQSELCNFDEHFCYVRNNGNGRTSRGCQEKLCAPTDNEQCCDTKFCNNFKFPNGRNECYNSQDKKTTSVCLDQRDNCFVKFTDGNLKLGCVKENDNDCTANSETCKVCSGNKCNKNAVCKNCNEIDGSKCKSELCEHHKCYAGIENAIMVRRCANKTEICASETYCDTCEGVNCNEKKMPDNWLKCHYCEGPDCSEEKKNPEAAVHCSKFYENDKCYVKGKGAKTSRGCRSDLPAGEKCEDADCVLCNTNACNSKTTQPKEEPLLCVQCDKEEPKCGPKYNATLTATPCKMKMPEGKADQCYSYKKDIIKRGCLSDLKNDEDCAKGETCHLCKDNGCNTKDISGATTVQNMLILIMASTITMMLTL